MRKKDAFPTQMIRRWLEDVLRRRHRAVYVLGCICTKQVSGRGNREVTQNMKNISEIYTGPPDNTYVSEEWLSQEVNAFSFLNKL